ncbi:response regulator [Undibacterium sp. Ji50W]|uniref:response regulator n=1 Tax=Undibacterium sp. Ji50W TaxID=3413041 RepID=UPI003BF1BABD
MKECMLDAVEILSAKILIVDDQEANVVLLEQMLLMAGYTAVSSTLDPQGVAVLHGAHRYDLILLNLQMPSMDGFEVIDLLRELEQEPYLPVLVVTAEPSQQMRALLAGVRDFVSVPFDLIVVQTRIRNMLEVRLLYQKLEANNLRLEELVLERTAELRASEARFKSFTQLSTDCYWEQDAQGNFTSVSGPVFEMLGIVDDQMQGISPAGLPGWNVEEHAQLDANIKNRRPFLDFIYSRKRADASMQYLQVSGEPIFDSASRFTGYRGIGVDITLKQR